MSEEERLRVGGDVDAWCTRCKMMLAHTIVAKVGDVPVKVECNTCGSVHKYRPKPPGTSRTGKEVARQARQTMEPAESWRNLLEARYIAGVKPVRYSVSTDLNKGDLVEHPKFGTGVVIAKHGIDKVEVRFEDDIRLLACCRKR